MINFFKNPKTTTIPNFSKQEECQKHYYPNKEFLCYPHFHSDCLSWYDDFEKAIFDAKKEKKYFPVFRLSDGEFTFVLGNRFNQFKAKKRLFLILLHVINMIKFQSTFYSSGRKGYCEHYKIWEIRAMRKRFAESLKVIAKYGMLCFNFSNSIGIGIYKDDFMRWVESKEIEITKQNYQLFYFVYGILFSSKAKDLVLNENVLIITSNMPERNAILESAILNLGAKNVEFYESSLNHPLKDKIDLSKIITPPGLVLIGAGVGAAYILAQLEPLSCLCIDAGFAVDGLGNIEMAKKRPYTISDIDWDGVYGKNRPAWM